jgi:hypothetical protein
MGRSSKRVTKGKKSAEPEISSKAPIQLDPSNFADPRMHQIALDIQHGKVPEDVIKKLHAFLLEKPTGAQTLAPSESTFENEKVKPPK